jgi:hypothetical protein
MNNDRQEGKWYWVKIKDEWFPAMYDPSACGGWTNTDTWEDFDNEVVAWQEITPPQAGNASRCAGNFACT